MFLGFSLELLLLSVTGNTEESYAKGLLCKTALNSMEHDKNVGLEEKLA